MVENDVRGTAAGYIRCAESLADARPDDDSVWDPAAQPDQAAYEAVHQAIRTGPASEAWALVTEVLRQVPDERLGDYAAGPLEDLVRLRGAELVAMIERRAHGDERFRWALGGIWLADGDLPPDVLARIVRASGGRIKPLGRVGSGRDPDPPT